MHPLATLCGFLTAWEVAWWIRRKEERARLFRTARAHANAIGKPLVVIGAPNSGPTRGPGCGDICVDIAPPSCPNQIQCDITKCIPLRNDSAVCFVSCVLEYVNDYERAWQELQRIAPGRVYNCRVEPWTLTAYLYPRMQRTLPALPEPT